REARLAFYCSEHYAELAARPDLTAAMLARREDLERTLWRQHNVNLRMTDLDKRLVPDELGAWYPASPPSPPAEEVALVEKLEAAVAVATRELADVVFEPKPPRPTLLGRLVGLLTPA